MSHSSAAADHAPRLTLAALLWIVVTAPAFGQQSDLAALEMGFELRPPAPLATPPLPDPGVFPVQIVLDDDGAEGVFGFSGSTARQFLWFNRFANPGPFQLEEVWVLFPPGMDVPSGGDVQLAVYLDADGDPATGAELLATYDRTIQATDGNTFSVYPLSPPLAVERPGDVLIGVVNRYFSGPPPTLPAALDTTASQDRSWFALWSGNPPNPPGLGTALAVDVLDGAVSGNFMIRGFGTPLPPRQVPTLGGPAIALLVALLGLVGAVTVRQRRSRASG